jgi:hypothetical protein
MALDGNMQAARLATHQPRKLRLKFGDLRQNPLRSGQQLHPRRRQLQRLRPANKQLHPRLILYPLDLMGQRTLRDVQAICRPGQPAGVMDGLDGAQMTKLDMHGPRPKVNQPH